jgi:isoquinoline 1-oxidoreductase subunit beta
MSRIRKVSRRGFLGNVFSAGALVIGSRFVPKNAQAAETVDSSAWHPSVFIGLEPDGSVILVTHRSEMGTGVRTSLPMILADELEADWRRVKIEQAIGDKKYGDQNTDGSNSITGSYQRLRETGASARMMLEAAAAAKWSVPASECHAKNHEVIHAPSGRKAGFGELVALAAAQPVPKPEDLKLKSPADFRYIGKFVPITDLDNMMVGKANFGIDAKMPGMVYASIERSPVLGGTLKSCDDSEAKKVAGVSETVTIPPFKGVYMFQALGGVAVIADNSWSAMQGRKKLKPEWDLGKNVAYDSAEYKKVLLETAHKPGKVERQVGDVDAAFAKATKFHEAEYYVPHLAHAPMEPPAAVAEYKDGKVVAYAAVQDPQSVQATVASALGIKPEDVTCHVTLLGGGFGRKSKPDYVAEAAILSKQVGKPVKIVWSREEDIKFDFYHAVAGMYLKASLDDNGRPTGWLGRSVYPPMLSMNRLMPGGVGFMGWSDLPFDLPNFRMENGPAEAMVRVGWLRSVANNYHAFAVHSFADELAALANRDRVEYLVDLLGKDRVIELRPAKAQGKPDPYALDTARTRRVLEMVAKQSNWANKKSGNGKGYGVAVHRSFQSYVASVVVNPDRVKAQFEGAAVFGTTLALMGEITAAGGKIVQSNFNNYPVARIDEAPYETHVTIVESDALPTGVGEPGVPPIAPAIANAIFAATGKRIRDLPIKKQLAS